MNISKNTIGYLNDDFKIFYLKDINPNNSEYHNHEFNKIIFFISGDVEYLVEKKVYKLKPYDLLFISKDEIHKTIINPNEDYERIVIWINNKYIKAHSLSGDDLLNCFSLCKQRESNLFRFNDYNTEIIKNLLFKIQQTNNSNEFGNLILRNSLFIQFMVLINRLSLENENLCNTKENKYDNIIKGVFNYINENLSNNLSIDKIASELFISKYYLMHKFKSQTGSSIYSYITQKRLAHAKILIKEGYLMKDVCIKCGFNDYSSFVRSFKKNYGISPKNYLKTIDKDV